MKTVDFSFLFFVVNITGSYIFVEHGIGESQIILVGLSAKTVNGHLVNKLRWKSKYPSYLLDLVYGKLCERAEISRRIAAMRHEVEIIVPYQKGNVLSLIHNKGQVLEEEYLAEGTKVKCMLDSANYQRVLSMLK